MCGKMFVSSISLPILVVFTMLQGNIRVTKAQALTPAAISSLINNFSDRDLLLFAMDIIINNPSWIKTLKETAIAAFPLLSLDHPPELFTSYVLPWAFSHLPDVISNEELVNALRVFINEVENHRANETWILQSNDTQTVLDHFVGELLQSLDYSTIVRNISATKYANSPELIYTLKDTSLAAVGILDMDEPPYWFTTLVLPWALKQLPIVLNNEDIKDIIKNFIHEVETHSAALQSESYENTTHEDSVLHLLGSLDYISIADGVVQKLFYNNSTVLHLLGSLDYASIADSIIQKFFPYNSTDRPLSEACYTDTMVFFDRLFRGDDWALNMFDAIGKPTTGIRRGVLYFGGTYDECQAVSARVTRNVSGDEHPADADIAFQGKYCRATFVPPRSLIESVAGEHINNTYGLPLTISLGLCLPDTCTGQDIEGLLRLGLLRSLFNLSVERAVCTEERNFLADTDAHIVIGILGGLALLVLVSSALDLCWMRCREPTHDTTLMSYGLHDAPFRTNNAYESFNGEKTNHIGDSPHKDGYKDVTETNAEDSVLENTEVAPKKSKRTHQELSELNISVDSDLTENILNTSVNVEEGNVYKLLRSFSVFTNMAAIFNSESQPGDITCLYGIRVLSMFWIVLGNTYLYTTQSVSDVPVAVDLMDSFDLMKRFTMQAVMSAPYATDTFFVISGCLISYWFLTKDEMRSTKINIKIWLKFYGGKLWKMTPPYMLVMVTFVYLYMYLGDGPMWPDKIAVADSCRQDWWKHLIYINNFVGVEGVSAEKQCMAWSWYIAVTMQFYLISPIILTFMAFSSSMGAVVTAVLAVAGMVASGVKEVEHGGEIITSRLDGSAYWNHVFTKPWCRVAPYCVGLLLGLILLRAGSRRPNKLVVAVGWLVALCLGIFLVYIPYTKYADGLEPWTLAQQAAYEALGRPVWGLCVAWVVYACATGFGGPLNEFLSLSGFIPLSRVTYLVYLLHPVLMVLVVYSRRTLLHLSDFEMAYQFVGHLVVNYAAAVAAALVFDFPFRNLKRVIHGKELDAVF
ncbi:O-acyltransferase like protein-like isoform X5 [Dreissena polymorpha]|uniref:O-acyltransferase like protein-like isoform X5 n=1 Tax=Dreissena polymorpha TaxID=45954 RepID=UPI002264642B|nr:O-acyltransferase like protein-like isoform X5 [Dreissena polymorpha]